MKIKNANFFQMHVEKIILGAAGLTALLIIVVYVIGSPYTAKITNQEMGPRKIEQYLQQQVQGLSTRIDSTAPQFDPPQIAPYSEELAARLETDAAPRPTVDFPLSRPGLAANDINVNAPLTPYDLPRPPATTNQVARAGFAVLGAQENPDHQQQLVQLVGQKTPWDIRYVSVEAEWPVKEWRTRLEQSELPASFWRSMIGVTSVYLQRQELNPETGEWGNPVIVERVPNQIAVMPAQKADYTDESATQLVRYLREQQGQVARPDFPTLAEGDVWLPPSSDYLNLDPDEQRRVADLRGDLNSLNKRIEALRRGMERQAQVQERRQARQTRQPVRQRQQPNFDEGDMGGRPGRARPGREMDVMERPQAQPTDRTQEAAAELSRLMLELQQKQNELNELIGVPQDTLTDPTQMMMDPYGEMYGEFGGEMGPYGPYGGAGPYGPGAGPYGPYGPAGPYGPGANPFARPQPGQPAQPQPGEEAPNNDIIRVWAHDLTVEPGKTYRYRVLVSVFNPLFRQMRVEETQRREFFDQLALGPADQEVASSPWSDPVRVDPEYYFFFVGGSAGQVATVEVWTIHGGKWHVSQFHVSPGDPIGGEAKVKLDDQTELPLNMTTGAVMVDLVASGGGMLGGDSRLLYFDPKADAIAARSSRQDEDSPDRIRLQNLRELQEQRRALTAASAR